MKLKTVIFDIDGTLADTLSICIESYRETLQSYLKRPFLTQEITSRFGKSEEGILGEYIPPEMLPQAVEAYFARYEELHQTCRDPFPGLRAVIERLYARGVPLGVVTGKGRRGADVTLRMISMTTCFSCVEAGSAEGPDKPGSLRRVLEHLALSPQEAVYAGDVDYDIEAACSIGMPAVGAAWAKTNTISTQTGARALNVFHNIADFDRWLHEIFP